MSEGFQTITVEAVQENVERVVLDRPQAANALNTRMARDITAYFETLALEPDRARCVVLTGRGERAFCAGWIIRQHMPLAPRLPRCFPDISASQEFWCRRCVDY